MAAVEKNAEAIFRDRALRLVGRAFLRGRTSAGSGKVRHALGGRFGGFHGGLPAARSGTWRRRRRVFRSEFRGVPVHWPGGIRGGLRCAGPGRHRGMVHGKKVDGLQKVSLQSKACGKVPETAHAQLVLEALREAAAVRALGSVDSFGTTGVRPQQSLVRLLGAYCALGVSCSSSSSVGRTPWGPGSRQRPPA